MPDAQTSFWTRAPSPLVIGAVLARRGTRHTWWACRRSQFGTCWVR